MYNNILIKLKQRIIKYKNYTNVSEIHIGNFVFEKGEYFTYLESIAQINNVTQEIKQRTPAANKMLFWIATTHEKPCLLNIHQGADL